MSGYKAREGQGDKTVIDDSVKNIANVKDIAA